MNHSQGRAGALLRQAVRFLGLSGIGWLMDFTLYTLLSLHHANLVLNNVFSSLLGASFVFLFSTRVVFRDSHRIPLWIKYTIYILYQLILIFLISRLLGAVNAFLLGHFTQPLIRRYAALLSKIIVTPVTMTVNFFVMKGVIEKL